MIGFQSLLSILALSLLQRAIFCRAWITAPAPLSSSTFATARRSPVLLSSTTTTSSDENKDSEKSSTKESAEKDTVEASKNSRTTATKEPKIAAKEDKEEKEADEDDDEDEYEYLEYDTLTEPDFLNSEWFVGTCWDSKKNEIRETWVRLAIKGNKNIAVWGDDAEGTWSLDVASQFLAISKEYLWGKQIWAGVVDDYYFISGTVRGWTYLTPASVLGQWQARRLGVDAEEAGTPPWFEVEDDDDDEEAGEKPNEEAKAKE
jgi:hypothetical protein